MQSSVKLSIGNAHVKELTVEQVIALCTVMGDALDKVNINNIPMFVAQYGMTLLEATEGCFELPEGQRVSTLAFSDAYTLWGKFHEVNAPFLKVLEQMSLGALMEAIAKTVQNNGKIPDAA